MFQIVKTPRIVQLLFPELIWRINTNEKVLYLTFDDGPHPTLTPWVLELLKAYNAKGTFFCLGKNVDSYSNVYEQILSEGHHVGNHTQHHLRGWTSRKHNYLQDVSKCAERVNSNLFRPPYGHISPLQIKALEKDYKIVMWDILSWDFKKEISAEKCLQNITNHASSGSIIVLHDNDNSEGNLRYILPKALSYYANKGYRFDAIPY